MTVKIKTAVYVDGLNFYYGCLKDSFYKWLDLYKLLQIVLGVRYQIEKIHYFTARVKERPDNLNAPQRQDTYLRALGAMYPEAIKIHYGYFLKSEVVMRRADNPLEKVKVIKIEEKGSDVNLSVHLLADALQDQHECSAVVTNDGDMTEAMKLVRQLRPARPQLLLVPERFKVSRLLRAHATDIRSSALPQAQLPAQIPGSTIHKPPGW